MQPNIQDSFRQLSLGMRTLKMTFKATDPGVMKKLEEHMKSISALSSILEDFGENWAYMFQREEVTKKIDETVDHLKPMTSWSSKGQIDNLSRAEKAITEASIIFLQYRTTVLGPAGW